MMKPMRKDLKLCLLQEEQENSVHGGLYDENHEDYVQGSVYDENWEDSVQGGLYDENQEDSVLGSFYARTKRILFLEVSDEEVSIMRNMMTLFPEVFMTRNRRICTGGVHDEK